MRDGQPSSSGPPNRGVSPTVKNRYHTHLTRLDPIQDEIGKASNSRSANILINALVDFRKCGDAVQNFVDALRKLFSETGPLFFVPSMGLIEFRASGTVKNDWKVHR